MPFDLDDERRQPGRTGPMRVAAAVLVLGLVASLLGAYALHDSHREREALVLRQQAAASVRQLELALQLALESLTSVKAFHDAGGALDAQQFDRFVHSEAQFHDDTLALGWAPRIGAAERAGFEAWLAGRAGRPTAIFEATGHGLLRVVRDCSDCYPVQYLTALDGGDVSPGINLPSLPSRARTIEAALASGLPTATKARRSDGWGADGDRVIQVFLAVREPGAQAPAPVAGLAMGVFNVSGMLRRVFAAPMDAVDVALFDLDAPAVEQRLFTQGRDGDDAQLPNDFESARRLARGAVTYEFRIADRHWIGLFAPRSSAPGELLLPMAGLLGGLLVTSLLALYLFVALARGRQVSALSGRLDGARQRLLDQQLTVGLERNLRQQAQAAVSARSRFLQTASHDLRQPLHALGLYLGLLNEDPGLARDAPFMRRLQQSETALHGMFDALLDWGRLESGHLEPELRSFDMAPLVERLGQEASALAAGSGLRVIVATEPAVVTSDALLIERIVRNLLVNAVRYTGQGWVAIGVRRRGAWVDLRVIDSGPGIARAQRERIFQPYVRDAGPIDGVGLGLAIVRTLAQQLGHELRLVSRVGRGSSFRLRLPAADALLPVDRPATAPPARLQGLTVLVVDDAPDVRAATQRLLRAWGAEVVVADGCAQASARLAERRDAGETFDLWLLDQHLGDGDGCGWLRAQRSANATTPVLLITAMATPALREEAAELGAVLVAKPLTALKLRSAIDAVLREPAAIAAA